MADPTDAATILQNQITALQEAVTNLQQDHQTLQRQNRTLKQENDTFKADIQGLKNDALTASAKIAVLVTQTSGASSKPKASLPDPEKFTGAPFSFETWLPAIKAKIRIDEKAIGDKEAQFYYVYSRLDGKIQALVMPQLSQAADDNSWDPELLIDQLVRIFDNPNKVQQAEDMLYKIVQGDDTFAVFLAKFERLLYKAKANKWQEPSKISLLRQALNPATRKRAQLISPTPTTYDEYVQKLKEATGGQIKDGGKHGGFKDKDAMEIDAIEACVGSLEFHVPDTDAAPPGFRKIRPPAEPSSTRANLNTISTLYDPEVDDDGHSVASYDSRASHSSEDFERTLERRHYGDRLMAETQHMD